MPPNPVADQEVREKPEIIEFLNIRDYTTHVESIVEIGEPIFQPFPSKIIFHRYQAHQQYKATLYLRNNDNVSRRVKVIKPASPYISIAKAPGKQTSTGKVATGMEVAYVITFSPESEDSYDYDIIVATEREKFIVPLKALGRAPALDFPDAIAFPPVCAKREVKKTFLMRSVGTAPAVFHAQVTEHFAVQPRQGHLGLGETLTCTVTATPPFVGECFGELKISFEGGEEVYCQLSAVGEEVDVSFSIDEVKVLPTFISRMSQKTFKVVNNSDFEANFCFKQHGTLEEEEEHRIELEYELADAQQAELRQLEESSGESESEDEDRLLGSTRLGTRRKYMALGKKLAGDKFTFSDAEFSVSPVRGAIMPHGTQEITVQFQPKGPNEKSKVAYCEISGKSTRQPIVFKGTGIGPKAVFSYDVLDVGDTFINTLHQYEVELMNRGEIEAPFSLHPPDSTFGKKFRFEPDTGVLKVGESHPVKVMFESDILGDFAESFIWKIQGASEDLNLDFRGRVVGPTFKLDLDEIDFGVVSYGFRYTQDFYITNTSEIPMKFVVRVDEDPKNEFLLVPSSGTLLPMGKQRISMELTSRTIRKYKLSLIVDLPGVGDAIQTFPVTAECMVPKIDVSSENLDFGDCFLRHPYKIPFQILNDSKLPAKFEVLPQSDQSKGLAEYDIEPKSGGIAAKGSQELYVTLATMRLGRIHLPVRIKIIGSQADPLELVIAAKSIGPALTFGLVEEECKGSVSIDFQQIPVLEEQSRPFYLHNPSLIPAHFKTFIVGKDSVYSVDVREGKLEPDEGMQLNVMVTVDDTTKFKDELHILVLEGDDTTVPLSSQGVGTTLRCKELQDGLHFNNQFTNAYFSKEFVLENQGRRKQEVAWSYSVVEEAQRGGSRASKTKKPGQPEEEEIDVVYRIAPEKATIAPKTSCIFSVTGFTKNPGYAKEGLMLRTTSGKKSKTIGEISVDAQLAHPYILFSQDALAFLYCFEPNAEVPKTMQKKLVLKNVSSLPLTVHLHTSTPFTVDQANWYLEPGQIAGVYVTFDIAYCQRLGRLKSSTFTGRITASYQENPQKDIIDLSGEINYPSLEMSATRIDFGCSLADTTSRNTITLHNNSRVDANFQWCFVEDFDLGATQASGKSSKKQRVAIPENQVFDILPIRGTLKPGASEEIEFAYFAYSGYKGHAKALCQVEGGSDYGVDLVAESGIIKYTFDTKHIDLGVQPYEKVFDKEVTIQNTGKVKFDFVVNLSTLQRAGVVNVSPMSGTLDAKGAATLSVRIRPGVPDMIEEFFLLEIAHFEAERINVSVEGTYPCCTLTLPRYVTDAPEHAAWRRYLEAAPESFTDGEPPAQFAAARTAMAPVPASSVPSRGRTATKTPGSAKPGTGKSTVPPPKPFVPSQLEFEMEADRLALCATLLDREREQELLREGAEAEGSGASTSRPPYAGGRSKPQSPVKGRKKQPLILSEYVIDFGFVIKGTQKVKKFKLKNQGWNALTLAIDKVTLDSNGFALEPDSIMRLPGQPEFATTEMTLTLQTSRREVKPGRLECTVPMSMKNGPRVNMRLQAVVVVPEVVVSSDTLDFGDVQSGTVKVISVLLENPKDVPADWALKKSTEGNADWAFFSCVPASGLLQPKERQMIKVMFTPVEDRVAPYAQKLPIKVTHNPKPLNLMCKGTGYTLKIDLEPQTLHLGAILPKTEEQAPNVAEFEISNGTDHDLEVFSLDFDTQYLDEEEILRHCPLYDKDDVMLLEPLPPGQGLWAKVVELDKQRKSREAKEAASGAEGEEETPEGAEGAPPEEEETPEEGVGELEGGAEVLPTDQFDDSVNIVLHGPPLAGRSVQAEMLASRYHLPIVDVEAVVKAALADTAALPEELQAKLAPEEEGGEAVIDGEIVAQVLRIAFADDEAYGKGMIVDGLNTSHLDPVETAKAVASALGLESTTSESEDGEGEGETTWSGSKQLHLNVLDLSLEKVIEREAAIDAAIADSRAEDAETAEAPPEAAPEGAEEAPGAEDGSEEGTPPPQIKDAKKQAEFEAYTAALPRLAAEFRFGGSPHNAAAPAAVSHRQFSADQPADAVFGEIVGFKHHLGEFSAFLPEIEADRYIVPDPYTMQIVKKPPPRPSRRAVQHFKIKTVEAAEPEAEAAEPEGEAAEGEAEAGEAALTKQLVEKSRWVIPKQSSIKIQVEFQSEDVGKFTEMLGFEVVGGEKHKVAVCQGICAYPQISDDYRNVFYKKVKTRPSSANISRQYIISDQKFDFGPLLAGKSKAVEEPALHVANTSKFRITNSGLFDLNVAFALRSAEEEPSDVFSFEPESMSLKVDETQDITVFAYPQETGLFEDSLVCTIEDNPEATAFPLSCVGDKPKVEITGLDEEGTIQFQRLILGQRDTRKFTVYNASLLPISWKLVGVEGMQPEISIFPTEGTLDARKSVDVTINLNAETQKVFEENITLEVQDMELKEVAQEASIKIGAEAYSIDVNVVYPDEELNGLDFGLVKVVDDVSKEFTVENTGKYEVGFKLTSRTQKMRDLFTITPEQGTIEPGSTETITLHFNEHHTLKKETTLKGNADITLAIIEELTGNKESVIPVKVDLRAVFCKYSILPARGLNFGPVIYDTESNPKVFDLTNSGEFPFEFNLTSYGDDEGTEAKVEGSSLLLGNFTVTPNAGTVEPGSVEQISVTFKAEKSRTYAELMSIDVTDRDPADHPGGIQYEIAGESCIPGINAEDVESIFEEHVVVAALDPFNAQSCVFAKREKCFDFGAVIANVSEDTDEALGVTSNLKISNPNKVPCTVNFSVRARGEGEVPMSVTPETAYIPPHEHRYVTITFAPKAIQVFSGVFEAVVENGGDPRTKSFSCELRGEGTLPHLVLSQQQTFNEEGFPAMDFARVLLGKEVRLPVVLRNDGVIPATGRVDMKAAPNFRLEDAPSGYFTVQPKKTQAFTVAFKPNEVEQYGHELKILVKQNQFDSQVLKLSGEGYTEDVLFGGLPEDLDNHVKLSDMPVGGSQVAFTLMNHSAKHFRYEWVFAEIPGLTLVPAAGHIHANSTKGTTISFSPTEAVTLENESIALKLTPITYGDEAPTPWDDSMVVEEYPAEDEAPDGEEDAGAAGEEAEPKVPEKKVAPEPECELDAAAAKEIALSISVAVDNSRYECETKAILFRPTMMFQSRSYSFELKNIASANMEFEWQVVFDDGTVDEDGPYVISPAAGVVSPEQTQIISVKFSPAEVEACKRQLKCLIPNLEPGYEPIVRELDGKVTRPWCHFHLPESDYISSGRRNPEMRGPLGGLGSLDPSTRVIEFESLGTKVRNVKRFFVLNPTNTTYEFIWEPVDASKEISGPFKCVNRGGVIAGGKKIEMIFEYTPDQNGLEESHWKFNIPAQSISVPFLLVGDVIEPRVSLEMASINFGKVLTGASAKQTIHIINSEAKPFSFSFDKSSYEANAARIASTGQQPVVIFEPSSGTVPPNGSLPIQAMFTPIVEKSINFNVVCHVRKKPTTLSLNAKGEGYTIHEALQLENPTGKPIELAPRSFNQIEFGQVLINDRSIKQISLLNSGDVNYNFSWNTGTRNDISVEPASGTVHKGEKVTVELCYSPSLLEHLDNYRVFCNVENGNRYSLSLSGQGHRPKLDFSLFSYDFGPRFVHARGMEPNEFMLRTTNNDDIDISYDILYENNEILEVVGGSTVLTPGQFHDIPIKFTPRAVKKYKETVRFEINGLQAVNISVTGEGCPMRVELANPAESIVNFGAIRMRQTSMKAQRIVNRSRIPVTISVAPSVLNLQRYGVTMIPTANLFLRAREAGDITFNFNPPGRTRQFHEDFVVDVNGVRQTIFSLSGACLGTEAKLGSDSLPFGSVVLGSKVVKRLQLENTGDVGTKFMWDTTALAPNFSIFPTEGFLAPHQDTKFDITFHPTLVNPDIRVEKVPLMIDGGSPQFLTLSGSCTAQEAEASVLQFDASVRNVETKAISMANTSNNKWHLKPVIQSDHWSGAEFLTIEPGKKADYQIAYKPISMTGEGELHEGEIFFPLPDGTGVLHKLTGRSNPPEPAGSLAFKVTAKQAHSETLKVANWLNVPQRFKVLIEQDTEDPAIRLTGSKNIDVPGLSEREFKVRFYSWKPGSTTAKVTFQNEITGEYLFYNLSYEMQPPEVQGTIHLEGPVRQYVSSTISITNPLETEVKLESRCDNPQVILPEDLALRPGADTQIEIKYRPLLVTETASSLTLASAELGDYAYDLKLQGSNAGLERSIAFNVPLGTKETKAFRFMHFHQDKCEYTCKFLGSDKLGFESEPSVVAHSAGPEGIEVEVEITYESTMIGENFRDTLVVSSPQGGEYRCPVVGRCVNPKPVGPFVVKGSAQVPFKNVMGSEVTYQFSCDNPAFKVKETESIPSKRTVQIPISYTASDEHAKTSKLVISCAESEGTKWCFYLQGE